LPIVAPAFNTTLIEKFGNNHARNVPSRTQIAT
jgi:hypothetical protein